MRRIMNACVLVYAVYLHGDIPGSCRCNCTQRTVPSFRIRMPLLTQPRIDPHFVWFLKFCLVREVCLVPPVPDNYFLAWVGDDCFEWEKYFVHRSPASEPGAERTMPTVDDLLNLPRSQLETLPMDSVAVE